MMAAFFGNYFFNPFLSALKIKLNESLYVCSMDAERVKKNTRMLLLVGLLSSIAMVRVLCSFLSVYMPHGFIKPSIVSQPSSIDVFISKGDQHHAAVGGPEEVFEEFESNRKANLKKVERGGFLYQHRICANTGNARPLNRLLREGHQPLTSHLYLRVLRI
ncbi:MAG: hypothetical protein ACKO13_10625 [Cytophagales bacterium]